MGLARCAGRPARCQIRPSTPLGIIPPAQGGQGSLAVRTEGSGALGSVRVINLFRGAVFWFRVDSAVPGLPAAARAGAQRAGKAPLVKEEVGRPLLLAAASLMTSRAGTAARGWPGCLACKGLHDGQGCMFQQLRACAGGRCAAGEPSKAAAALLGAQPGVALCRRAGAARQGVAPGAPRAQRRCRA
jgi:hypothetical protein